MSSRYQDLLRKGQMYFKMRDSRFMVMSSDFCGFMPFRDNSRIDAMLSRLNFIFRIVLFFDNLNKCQLKLTMGPTKR